jgi:hypothetical protein
MGNRDWETRKLFLSLHAPYSPLLCLLLSPSVDSDAETHHQLWTHLRSDLRRRSFGLQHIFCYLFT